MRKGMGLLVVLSLLLSGILLVQPANSMDVMPAASALTPHAPIFINNNTDLAAAASSGNGTVWAPWIIENLDIDSNGSKFSIYVGNTTEDFVIRNCSLGNTSMVYSFAPQDAGISCYNVTNGTLQNNTLTKSWQGIALFNSTCLITQNNCTNNSDDGIHLWNSNGCQIINNSFCENSIGVNITDSIDYQIYHNNFFNNSYLQGRDINGWANWCLEYPGGGNYWSDHVSNDIYNGPNQDWLGSDGILDDRYMINAVIDDFYPLAMPYSGQAFGENLPPYANIWGPQGIDVPVSSSIYIQWNESMNWTVLESGFTYTNGTDTWNSTDGAWTHDAITFNSTFTPFQDFEYSTYYVVEVDCNITDYIGNPLDQNGDGTGGMWPADILTWDFTTEDQDLTPPTALAYSPNGTAALLNSTIQIGWNETMDWPSVETAFSYTDGALNYSSANGTWLHDNATNTSVFTPTDLFEYEHEYFVTVNCTASDIAGNLLDQDGNGTGGMWPDDVLTWNFTAVDEAPHVVSTVPGADQVNVDPGKPIVIQFSEPMNQSSVENAFWYTNATLTFNTGNGTEIWNAQRTEFTFVPVPILELNQTYNVYLNGSMARDAGGRIIGNNYSWKFTTWAEPPPPHVEDVYPLSGTFNVPVNTHINVIFDMEMDTLAVENAFTYTDGTDVWDITDGAADWFSSNTLFSFQPNDNLEFDTTYTVIVGTNSTSIYGKTLDGNDNGVSEPTDEYVFTFTTALEPPTITSHYPDVDEIDVPIDIQAIYLNFSKPMNTISVTNGVSIYPTVSYTPSFSSDQKNLTLILNSNLQEGTPYRVTVMNTALDLVGTALDGNNDGVGNDRFQFNFATEGGVTLEYPDIDYVFPTLGSVIPIDSVYFTVTFNQEMNKTSTAEAFSVRNETSQINGTISWSATGKTLRFTSDVVLEYNTTYTLTVENTARAENGLYLQNTTTWSYTTEPEPVETPVTDYIMYAVIAILLVLTIMLYMANRSLRMDLKKNTVMLKRAMKMSGLTEEDLKKRPAKKEPEQSTGPPSEEDAAAEDTNEATEETPIEEPVKEEQSPE